MSDATPASPTISIQFGKPNHGWLPVSFQADTFQLELDVSDAPINPLEFLCEALTVVPTGGSAEVLWFLEPAACWFAFAHEGKEIVLTITESPNWEQAGTCVLRLTGSVEKVLLPFYKALKDFNAQGFRHPHWPTLGRGRVAQIGRSLQAYC